MRDSISWGDRAMHLLASPGARVLVTASVIAIPVFAVSLNSRPAQAAELLQPMSAYAPKAAASEKEAARQAAPVRRTAANEAAPMKQVAPMTQAAPAAQKPQLTLEQMKAQYRRPATIPYLKNNPYTLPKASLGKKLYFDTRMSGANVLSCGSCHSPAYGCGDGQPRGIGHGMKKLGRRSPTIINAAFGGIFMWDGARRRSRSRRSGPSRPTSR